MKKLLIPAAVLLGITAVLIGVLLFMGLSPHIGIYLEADNGSPMIVLDSGSPIVMVNRTGNEEAFSGLETGDKLFVLLVDSMDASYPGTTGAYFVLRISENRLDEVPQETLDTLAELRWISF